MLSLMQEYHMIPRGSRVLCALSGGADSAYLFYRLYHLQSVLDFTLCAAHFNHQLRGAESQRDADFVQDFVAQWGKAQVVDGNSYPAVELVTGSADVQAVAQENKQSIELTARQLRYGFLEETAQKLNCDRIATAHHADDNLETVLLRLTRGTGLHGLAGIPPVRGKIIRPLLTTPRSEIEGQIKLHNIPFVVDSSNQCLDYSRNKIRHQVLPVLQSLNPQVVTTSAESIAHLRADDDYLRQLAEEALGVFHTVDNYVENSAEAFLSQPKPVAYAMVRLLLEALGLFQFSTKHLDAVVKLCYSAKPSAWVSLPDGLVARRVYDRLVLERPTVRPMLETVHLDPSCDQQVTAVGWNLHIYPSICPKQPKKNCFYLDVAQIQGDLHLRPRQTGDSITLNNQPTKTLKKLFIDRKIPRLERDSIPVLADEAGVLWVAGIGAHQPRVAEVGRGCLVVEVLDCTSE